MLMMLVRAAGLLAGVAHKAPADAHDAGPGAGFAHNTPTDAGRRCSQGAS